MVTNTPPPDARRIGEHLDDAPLSIRGLLDRARGLRQIEEIVRTWAPAPLNQELRVANVRDGVLVLYIETAAAYTALRYRQPELLDVLRQRCGLTIRTVEIRTRPVENTDAKAGRTK